MNRTDFDFVIGNKAGDHLGDLIGWSMKDVKIPCLKAHAWAKEFGLEDDLIFPKLNATSAYRRAVRKATCKGTYDNRKYTAVRLIDDDKYVGHAIVRSDIIDLTQVSAGPGGELIAKDAAFETDVKIGLNKQLNGVWTSDPSELLVTTDASHEIVKEITQKYRDLIGVYTFDDIRKAFQEAFDKWAGMRMLTHGGLWLVLAEYSDKIHSWKKFMKKMECDSLIIPIFDTEEGTSSFRKIAQDNLMQQVGDLRLEIKGFAKKTRKSTMEKRLDDFRTLREKTKLYKKALGAEVDGIETMLLSAEQELSNILLQKENEQDA